jgi:hypothetical protein
MTHCLVITGRQLQSTKEGAVASDSTSVNSGSGM